MYFTIQKRKIQLKIKDHSLLPAQLSGNKLCTSAVYCRLGRGRRQGGGAGVAKRKKKEAMQKSAALLYGFSLRLSRCRRLKPGNMVAACFLRKGLTALAGLLLLSFGTLAASQIEVGIRPSERQGPGRTAVLRLWAHQQTCDSQQQRGASASHLAELWGGYHRAQDRTVSFSNAHLKFEFKESNLRRRRRTWYIALTNVRSLTVELRAQEWSTHFPTIKLPRSPLTGVRWIRCFIFGSQNSGLL